MSDTPKFAQVSPICERFETGPRTISTATPWRRTSRRVRPADRSSIAGAGMPESSRAIV